jgi:hypothetical protein
VNGKFINGTNHICIYQPTKFDKQFSLFMKDDCHQHLCPIDCKFLEMFSDNILFVSNKKQLLRYRLRELQDIFSTHYPISRATYARKGGNLAATLKQSDVASNKPSYISFSHLVN